MTTTEHDVERYAGVDLYGVLHVTAQADAELIDRAYRMRMHAVHPDGAGAPSTDLAALPGRQACPCRLVRLVRGYQAGAA